MNASEKIPNQPFKFELGQPVSGQWGAGVVFARIAYDAPEYEANRYLVFGEFADCVGYSIKESSLTATDVVPPLPDTPYQQCADKAAWFANHSDKVKVDVMTQAMFETLKGKK
ncbi:hypothetical protein [Conchiformibius steedae]|uniref:hypothetical protein n=1 Tax=Conchiformibius steedae TaxID=153493 RepID=UPI0026EB97A9|nr:hypothetical protein [Conchiformibius steedae]